MTDHKNIYSALAAAQAEMGKALKQSDNPHFRSKYADLGNVMDACLPALNRNGIAVIQPMESSELGHVVRTVFLHESGERLECPMPLILGKNDMQGLGSAITYARRYGLMSLAGIAPEDDDGNGAVGTARKGTVRSTGDAGQVLTFAQEVLKDLDPAATDKEKARALTDAIKAQWKRKKTVKQIENEWDRQAKTVDFITGKFPEMGEEIREAYELQFVEVSPSETVAAE